MVSGGLVRTGLSDTPLGVLATVSLHRLHKAASCTQQSQIVMTQSIWWTWRLAVLDKQPVSLYWLTVVFTARRKLCISTKLCSEMAVSGTDIYTFTKD